MFCYIRLVVVTCCAVYLPAHSGYAQGVAEVDTVSSVVDEIPNKLSLLAAVDFTLDACCSTVTVVPEVSSEGARMVDVDAMRRSSDFSGDVLGAVERPARDFEYDSGLRRAMSSPRNNGLGIQRS